MFLQNLFYQVFVRSSTHSRRPQGDPEQGQPVSTARNTDIKPPNAPSETSASGAGESGAPEQSEDEHLGIDDERDENDIIRHLEEEEFPTERRSADTPQRRRPFRHFSTFPTFSTLTSASAPKSWYPKLKSAFSTHTSKEDLDSYIPNYRYTPIISGIVIPFSILLEIPGLTEHWYVKTEANHTVDTKPNSVILDVGLGFSMACALLANVCLVTRFMEKRVKLMTILCVSFLTIHDVINIICITVFGVQHNVDDGFTYGPAFWMTFCSTIASSFTNLTLIIDLIRTPDFSKSGSGLTRKQRSLVIIVIILLCYIAFGALIFTFLLDQKTFIDSLYFTVVSIETIGFGDITPSTTSARVFACFYSIIGILNIVLVVGLTRETVLESLEIGYRLRVKAHRERRKAAQWQERVEKRWRSAVEWRLKQAGKPVWVKDSSKKGHRKESGWGFRAAEHGTYGEGQGFGYGYVYGQGRTHGHGGLHGAFGRIWRWRWWRGNGGSSGFLGGPAHAPHPRGMHLNVEALEQGELEGAAMEVGVPLGRLVPPGFESGLGGTSSGFEVHSSGGGEGGSGVENKCWTQAPVGGQGFPLTQARLGRMIALIGNFAIAVDKSAFTGDKMLDLPSRRRQANRALSQEQARGVGDEPQQEHESDKPLAEQYASFKAGMEKEEKWAFIVRLGVVLTLFTVFWTVGSAIFSKTEGWEYGTAMYFCFIAFTTIGYGDLTPKTPAGRSIFVFWALLGVATMTILISIIAEAFSDRYKSIFHSGLFDQAVKRYRENMEQDKKSLEKVASSDTDRSASAAMDPPSIPKQDPFTAEMTSSSTASAPPPLDTVERALTQAREKLEALPHEILLHARSFNDDVRYFIEPTRLIPEGAGGTREGEDKMPEGLRRLVDDIAGAEKMKEGVKREILKDADARQTLLTLSIEKALQKIIEVTESAVAALAERDKLLEQQRQRQEREKGHVT